MTEISNKNPNTIAAQNSVRGLKIDDLFSGKVDCKVTRNVDLSQLSRWKIGGIAKYLVEPTSVEGFVQLMSILGKSDSPYLIIGTTSNILFDSRGFDGVLVRTDSFLNGFSIDGNVVHADAGALITDLVRAVATAGLEGINHAAGIPGTIGGLVTMNGGTQRRGIGENISRVWIVDFHGKISILNKDDLKFSYRSSALKSSSSAILKVEILLNEGNPGALIAEVESNLLKRSAKFPENVPNCGSTFLSNPDMYDLVGPPGRVLEEAGLKGFSRGNAQFSLKHANFIVNTGGAVDDDVLWLISYARYLVKKRTGFVLDCEVLHLSPSGELRPAHEVAEERWPINEKEETFNA